MQRVRATWGSVYRLLRKWSETRVWVYSHREPIAVCVYWYVAAKYGPTGTLSSILHGVVKITNRRVDKGVYHAEDKKRKRINWERCVVDRRVTTVELYRSYFARGHSLKFPNFIKVYDKRRKGREGSERYRYTYIYVEIEREEKTGGFGRETERSAEKSMRISREGADCWTEGNNGGGRGVPQTVCVSLLLLAGYMHFCIVFCVYHLNRPHCGYFVT